MIPWLWIGCDRPSPNPGTPCELNTECAPPLVCRLGRCRTECRITRDCPIGQSCVRAEEGIGNVCQVPEDDCTLSSQCPGGLVCRAGRCTSVCETVRDCPAGSRCSTDSEGVRGCIDTAGEGCQRNSDCEPFYICGTDRRCREECITNRDCRDGTLCNMRRTPHVCEHPGDGGLFFLDSGADGAIVIGADGGPDAGADGGSGVDAGGDAGTPLPSMRLLGAGTDHTCAVPMDGVLRCWGNNLFGQIGNGTSGTTEPAAVVMGGLTGIRAISAGAFHTCASASDGVYCWGRNADGELGIGVMGMMRTSPVLATTRLPQTLVSGAAHTCALDGTQVLCWGRNMEGPLGDGTTTSRDVPTAVTISGTPMDLAAGGRHSCAVLTTGDIYCWGSNSDGQIGDGTMAQRNSPTLVSTITNAVAVEAGSNHTCALLDDDTLRCWGRGSFGRLGDGFLTTRTTPVAVVWSAGSIPVLLTAGQQHTCALAQNGSVWCWGNNSSRQIGQDVAFPFEFEFPTEVTALSNADSISSGDLHNCTRIAMTDTFQCWGQNAEGQLGSAPGTATAIPNSVSF